MKKKFFRKAALLLLLVSGLGLLWKGLDSLIDGGTDPEYLLEVATENWDKIDKSPLECVVFLDPKQTETQVMMEVYEKHNKDCGGDPETASRITVVFLNKKTRMVYFERYSEAASDFVKAPLN